MIVVTSKSFDKKFKKLSKKIQLQAKERISLFTENPFSVILNNHMLHGDQMMLRSINVNADIRIVYEKVDDTTVRFLEIDTHSNLY